MKTLILQVVKHIKLMKQMFYQYYTRIWNNKFFTTSVASESLNVGTAITASGGIVTATSFVGDGSNITILHNHN